MPWAVCLHQKPWKLPRFFIYIKNSKITNVNLLKCWFFHWTCQERLCEKCHIKSNFWLKPIIRDQTPATARVWINRYNKDIFVLFHFYHQSGYYSMDMSVVYRLSDLSCSLTQSLQSGCFIHSNTKQSWLWHNIFHCTTAITVINAILGYKRDKKQVWDNIREKVMCFDLWRLNHSRQIMCIFEPLRCDILVWLKPNYPLVLFAAISWKSVPWMCPFRTTTAWPIKLILFSEHEAFWTKCPGRAKCQLTHQIKRTFNSKRVTTHQSVWLMVSGKYSNRY